MISENEARAKILEAVRPLPARRMSIVDTLDHFAARDYSPPDESVRPADKPGKRLRVVGEQPAGVDRKLRVTTGEAIRIFTGAPMPAGANAIVMQEDVTRNGDEIVVNADVDVDEFVRKRGCDLGEGQKIVNAG